MSGSLGCIEREIEVLAAALSPQAILPVKAHPTDAGFDLAIPADVRLDPGAQDQLDLEFALQIPVGWYGQIFARSSMFRRGLAVHPGVIDADYRGSIQLLVVNQGREPLALQGGDRIAQLLVLPVPAVTLVKVPPSALSDSVRGQGGFGSTGR